MIRFYKHKEKSYMVQEMRRRDFLSPYEYEEHHGLDEVSKPIIHKMVHNVNPSNFQYLKPSSYGGGHHDDDDQMMFIKKKKAHWENDDARGWCGTHQMNGHYHDEDHDMAFGGSHWDETCGWSSGNHRVNGSSSSNNNSTMKKNEHQVMGAKSGSILRPPLGSVKPPTPPSVYHQYHQNHTMYEGSWQLGGANRDEGRRKYHQGDEGSNRVMMVHNYSSSSNNNDKSWMGAPPPREYELDYNHNYHGSNNNHDNWMIGSNKFEDHDHHGGSSNTDSNNWMRHSKKFDECDDDGRLREESDALIKRLQLGGGVVHKVELIEYERKATSSYGAGIRTYLSPIPPPIYDHSPS